MTLLYLALGWYLAVTFTLDRLRAPLASWWPAVVAAAVGVWILLA